MKHSSSYIISFTKDYFLKIGEINRSQEESKAASNKLENYCAFDTFAMVTVLKVKGKSLFSRPIVDSKYQY